jgi:hypothetical protein
MLGVHLIKQLSFERFRERFYMHIVTISSSFAAAIDVLLAFSVHEISDRRKDSIDLLSIEVTPIY